MRSESNYILKSFIFELVNKKEDKINLSKISKIKNKNKSYKNLIVIIVADVGVQ